jgi:hypothetical protein
MSCTYSTHGSGEKLVQPFGIWSEILKGGDQFEDLGVYGSIIWKKSIGWELLKDFTPRN